MDKDVASLLVRQAMALMDEGIGPVYPESTDQGLLNAAIEVVGDEFDRHYLWNVGLLSSEEHVEDVCRRGSETNQGRGCRNAQADIDYEKLKSAAVHRDQL